MRLLCFGLGYCAEQLIATLGPKLEHTIGTTRSAHKQADFKQRGIQACALEAVDTRAIHQATHILISIPPGLEGDRVFAPCAEAIASHPSLTWLGYLSTTGVYGDHQGGWVDETTPPQPLTARSRRRLDAEHQWLSLYRQQGVPTHIFRLSGIYGPGRSALDRLTANPSPTTNKPGHYFSRIHVADIAGILAASMQAPTPGETYNVADDYPCNTPEVIAYAADLLGIQPPKLVAFEHAELSEMGREFYASNKRVRNDKVKRSLAYNLLYPSYKEGLRAIDEL